MIISSPMFVLLLLLSFAIGLSVSELWDNRILNSYQQNLKELEEIHDLLDEMEDKNE